MVDGLNRLPLQPADGVDADPRRGGGHDGSEDRRGRGSPGHGSLGHGSLGRGEKPHGHQDNDFACMFGIPDAELTPRVRRALIRLLDRFDEARRQIDAARDREAYLHGLADGHPVLPLGNRRFLIRELSRIIERTRIAQTINSFVVISIANGARIRADHGEAAAHALLCEAAQILVSGVRASDVVASLGGYDFGVVLTLAASDAAAIKACALARSLGAKPVDHAGRRLRAEPVWGLHEIARSDTADAVIAAADLDLVARTERARH